MIAQLVFQFLTTEDALRNFSRYRRLATALMITAGVALGVTGASAAEEAAPSASVPAAPSPASAPPPAIATAPALPGVPVVPKPASIDSRDPKMVPVLAKLVSDGYKVRFMRHDDSLGLDIWFVTLPTNVPQPVYVTGDGKALIGGHAYMIKSDANPTELTYLTGQHFVEATAVLANDGIFPVKQADQSAPSQQPAPLPPAQGPQASATTSPVPAVVSAAPARPQEQPPRLTGAGLLTAFDGTHFIEAGKPEAPLMYAVVDPQ